MTTKIKTIKLSDGHAPRNITAAKTEAEFRASSRFRVEQITDSIDYRTGDMLERNEVEALCASREWKVTIVPIR